MIRNFQLAVDTLGQPDKRDVERYLSEVGIPVEGKSELLKIPRLIIKSLFLMDRINRTLRPDCPYDVPFLPFNIRAGHKFLDEYDTDFSRATIDGDLSKDFDPVETLKRVRCPMLLLWAHGTRHETWGLVGAMDENDLQRVIGLVDDLQCVEIPGAHEIHMVQPQRYIEEVMKFVERLRRENKLT